MCGIIGLIGSENQSSEELLNMLLVMGIHIQHRGQANAGLAYSDGERLRVIKGNGLLTSFFTTEVRERIIQDNPKMFLFHVRYSTSGSGSIMNAQPHYLDTLSGRIALASNGDVPNLARKKKLLENQGADFYTDNDAEFLLKHIGYLAGNQRERLVEAVISTMKSVPASYSAGLMTKDQLIIFRDPWGNRPLVIGEKDGCIIFASETCALDGVGAEFVREVNPAEIIVNQIEGKQEFVREVEQQCPAHCIFEHIYFARPDSNIFGEVVGTVRFDLGKRLAIEHPVDVDYIAPVPESGYFAAVGYETQSGLPLRLVLIRNPYIHRTFIEPGQSHREGLAHLKYNPMRTIFQHKKRIGLVDDSIVRGTTNRQYVIMLRGAGSEIIAQLISSPPICYCCNYGMNIPTRIELCANRFLEDGRVNTKRLGKSLDVNYLGYLSMGGLRSCVKNPDHFCYACFNGKYPIPLK